MAADVSRKARKFREYWLWQRGSEKGEDQQFWNMLLRDVLGMDEVERRLKPQVPVPMKGTTKFLDFWIPETKVLIEHKSRDIKLDAPQSSHGGKTPFEQALEYNQARGYSDKARWIVTCNFDEIWVYDMNHPLEEPQKIRLTDLPKEVSRLGFLVDASIVAVRDQEKDISIKAGRIIGEIYRELLKRYAEPDSPETLKHLNRLCVRLVFLFYAEDAELFDKDAFWSLLTHTPAGFLRQRLLALFRALDTPKESRDPYLEPEIAVFPYTNGGLFKGVDDAEIPPLDEDLRALLVKSSNFDWREISPTIFGALFESTLNPETRRSGGMVYTSVENIHKVIDPLFPQRAFGRHAERPSARVPGQAGRPQVSRSGLRQRELSHRDVPLAAQTGERGGQVGGAPQGRGAATQSRRRGQGDDRPVQGHRDQRFRGGRRQDRDVDFGSQDAPRNGGNSRRAAQISSAPRL